MRKNEFVGDHCTVLTSMSGLMTACEPRTCVVSLFFKFLFSNQSNQSTFMLPFGCAFSQTNRFGFGCDLRSPSLVQNKSASKSGSISTSLHWRLSKGLVVPRKETAEQTLSQLMGFRTWPGLTGGFVLPSVATEICLQTTSLEVHQVCPDRADTHSELICVISCSPCQMGTTLL